MKRIIIFNDFERDYIYDASSDIQLLEAFLATFKRRWNSFNAYYFSPPLLTSFTKTEKEYLEMDEQDIIHLPEGIRKMVINERQKLTSRKASNKRASEEYAFWKNEADQLLALNDNKSQISKTTTLYKGTSLEKETPTVMWLLEQRNHLQGEQFKVVILDDSAK